MNRHQLEEKLRSFKHQHNYDVKKVRKTYSLYALFGKRWEKKGLERRDGWIILFPDIVGAVASITESELGVESEKASQSSLG